MDYDEWVWGVRLTEPGRWYRRRTSEGWLAVTIASVLLLGVAGVVRVPAATGSDGRESTLEPVAAPSTCTLAVKHAVARPGDDVAVWVGAIPAVPDADVVVTFVSATASWHTSGRADSSVVAQVHTVNQASVGDEVTVVAEWELPGPPRCVKRFTVGGWYSY